MKKGKNTYIKIDLEGYDYKALLGAEELIRENKPKIAVITYHNFHHAEDISAYLKSKGIYQKTGSPIMLHAWM